MPLLPNGYNLPSGNTLAGLSLDEVPQGILRQFRSPMQRHVEFQAAETPLPRVSPLLRLGRCHYLPGLEGLQPVAEGGGFLELELARGFAHALL